MACKNCDRDCHCRLGVMDSNTLDFTLTGTGNRDAEWDLQAVALISGRPPTTTEDCGTGNFMVERVAADGGLCVPLSTDPGNRTRFGDDGGIYTDPFPSCIAEEAQGCLVPDDDGCLTLAVPDEVDFGNGPCTNALRCEPEGLFVPGNFVVYDRPFDEVWNSQMPTVEGFEVGFPRVNHHNDPNAPTGNGDRFSDDPADMVEITNPSNCCDLLLRMDHAMGNSPAYNHNPDLCAVAAFYRAAPGAEPGMVFTYRTTGEIWVDGALHGIVTEREFSFEVVDPAEGVAGCGIRFHKTDNRAFAPAIIVPPGATIDVDFRLYTEIISNPFGQAAREMERELFFGVEPHAGADGLTSEAPFRTGFRLLFYGATAC